MFLRVLLPLPFNHTFDYLPLEEIRLDIGDYVKVSFGQKELVGVVWEVLQGKSPHSKVKKILEKISLPPFPSLSRAFLEWVAAYTLTPQGLILKMSLSSPQAFSSLKDKENHSLSSPSLEAVPLSLDQEQAVLTILENYSRDISPKTYLLDGVTGSGKTEVYFKILQKIIENGQQSLILLPEISLSSQWLDRFQQRFKASPVLWHSSLTPAQRRKNWRAIVKGEAQVIVGARSALFMPYLKLGLIIVDEEHDSSYKQEDSVIYNARDMAVVRGHLGKIPVVLASATPSLESLENCRNNKYAHLRLPARYGKACFPTVNIIDMRTYTDKQARLTHNSQWISPPLFTALRETLARREQALLFLNRRGYAPLTMCGGCGEKVSCLYCTSWLVEHRYKGSLVCHQCGHTLKTFKNCMSCGKEDKIIACGPGVERVAEDFSKLLPQARYQIVTSDVIHSFKAFPEMISRFENHEVDVLIGTQILAKGFHFPNLTLVGVIDADLGLSGSDLRASEKTYQLLHQVAGRAGRADKPGQVLLQTYQPHHPLFKALISHDRELFLTEEKRTRDLGKMPPFSKLVSLIISSSNVNHIEKALKIISAQIPSFPEVDIWGPAPAPLSLLKGKLRWRYLLKAPKTSKVQKIIQVWLKDMTLPRTVKVQIDFDPYSFL